MARAKTNEEDPKRSSSLGGSIRHYKNSQMKNASLVCPLSPTNLGSYPIDLTIDDATKNSTQLMRQNVCDMEIFEESHPTHNLTTYDIKSRIDSEFQHHIIVGNDTQDDIKKVVMVEHKENLQKETPPSKKKAGNKGARCMSLPTSRPKVEGKTNNVINIRQKPPISKRNITQNSRRSILSSSPYKEKKLKYQNVIGGDDVENGIDNPDLGPYLLKKARDIISSGDNPKKAFDLTLRAKKSFESCAFDKPNLDFVMCLHVLASMYCSLDKHEEAVPLLKRSIEIPNIDLGQKHALAKFIGCMQLGDVYAMLGQIENSILLYKVGLEVQKKVLGEQDPRFGKTCRYVAEAYVQAFEFDEAEKLCQMALNIHEANGSPTPLEEAADRRLMGLICESKGNHETALEHYILARRTMVCGGQELEIGAVDCNIGDAYLALARYDEAIFSYQKALSIFKSSKGDNHSSIALAFVRLAELYNKVGKFGESKVYCENAIQIYNEPPLGNTNMEDIANGLIDLAAIYESMYELDKSIDLLVKALEMYNDMPGQQSMTAGIEAQIGVIYYTLGNHVSSYRFLKSSISKFQDLGAKKSSIYGITLNQLGLACVQLYSISEAVELFEEARCILEREYGSYHPDTLGVYSNLAGTYDALARWDDAINLLEYVVAMREEKLGTADPVVNDEKRRLAELLKEAGRVRSRKSQSLKTLLDKTLISY